MTNEKIKLKMENGQTIEVVVFSKRADAIEVVIGEGIHNMKFTLTPTRNGMAYVGSIKGRENDDEVTCFLNYLGLGYQFAAAGSVVIRKARELGVGTELPTDWFTEDEHP